MIWNKITELEISVYLFRAKFKENSGELLVITCTKNSKTLRNIHMEKTS